MSFTMPKPPEFGSNQVLRLLESIAGGKHSIDPVFLKLWWHDLLLYAAMSMRSRYENEGVPEDHPLRRHFKPYWAEIEAAGNDYDRLSLALEKLRIAIYGAPEVCECGKVIKPYHHHEIHG